MLYNIFFRIIGVFGGSLPATGATDPTILLLAVRGFVVRHLNFVQQLIALKDNEINLRSGGANKINLRSGGKRNAGCLYCSVVSNAQAVVVLRSILQCTEACIHSVFSIETFAQDKQDIMASACLGAIYTQSMRLFTNVSRTLEQLREFRAPVLECCKGGIG